MPFVGAILASWIWFDWKLALVISVICVTNMVALSHLHKHIDELTGDEE